MTERQTQQEPLPRERVLQLVTRAQEGDDEAFGELVTAFHERVYGVIYRMVNNAELAQELEQRAWIKAWRHIRSYKGDSQFFTWLYRIAINAALDEHRRQVRKREVSLDDVRDDDRPPIAEPRAPVDTRPDRAVEREEFWRVFESALQQLSPEHRAALVLREVEGLSYEEIARALGCRIGTVMSRLFYARRHLQSLLRDWI